MGVIIKQPAAILEEEMIQIVNLINQGSQVQGNSRELRNRINNSAFVSFIIEDGKIISMAALKNPADSYKRKVFEAAQFLSNLHEYKYELGYIVTAENRQGEKLCQKLLSEFIPLIANYKMFATTRKESMVHILGKFGFLPVGVQYNTDLSLLVN